MVLRMYDEVMNQGKLEVVDELVTEDFLEHEAFPGLPPGREGVKAAMAMFRTGFPDLHMEAESVVASGEMVAARSTLTGTHEGEFMGIPATGKSVRVAVMDFLRFENGLAAEHWGLTDTMAMLQQLGVAPE